MSGGTQFSNPEGMPRPVVMAADRLGPRLLRSAAVRFGLVYALLFALSTLALVGFLWYETAGLLERQAKEAIDRDGTYLQDRFNTMPPPDNVQELHGLLASRFRDNLDSDVIYVFLDPYKQLIIGNITKLPVGILDEDQYYFELPVQHNGRQTRALLRPYPLEDGYLLLVGRDFASPAFMRGMLTQALLWAAGVVLLLGTAGAFAVRGLFRMTIADVSATAAAISAGDLTRRVRRTGDGDEFDQLAETINDMLDRIGRLMDGVRQVSNAIAHDLRTPITRARARLEDAVAHASGEADLRAAIERAQADLDGVVAVFQALLRIAEIEAGSRRSAFAVVDLAPLLLDLADLYGAAAEENGQTLVAAIAPHVITFGDRDMIQQAVANLLDNALKYSPPGSTIRVTAEAPAEPGSAGGVRIGVSDQGPGIPEEERARATERFFRGEQARSTPGAGLGLALVQAVATLHGGALELHDNNPGLSAVLLLPMHAPLSVGKKALT